MKSKSKLASQKRSGSQASKATKYTFHDQLTFLDRVEGGPTDINFISDADSQDPSTPGAQDDDIISLLGDDSQTEASAHQERKGDRSANFKRQKRSKNSAFEESLIDLLKESKEKEDDDDKAFFTSLLPSVKTFTPDQKLMFRSQVLQLVMSMKRNAETTRNMTVPFPNPPFPYEPNPSNNFPPGNFYPNQANQQYPNQANHQYPN